ncbi:M48 family metallopeptidase [Methylococcus mesophilus]|uniref:M48 family metallopeptidase n=1 Tax=Methylococcus mesophilus TaxID=2993564 RepID=UPI00224AA9FD|nr:M48 family metallopeptidase [Methylococcus mesophilus]UZR30688.1 M48 family metallopeptidase [Methylococcus mesophilus]
MNTFTTLFLAALAVSSGIEYWLARRQASHVRLHRDRVPEAFRDSVSLEDHRKAADYTLAKGSLGDVGRIVGIVILLGFTLGGGIDAIAQLWSGFELSPIATGVGVVLTTLLVSQFLELPLSLYQTFRVEERFGFNRTTPRQFAIDLGLQTALSVVIGGPLLALILWVMDSSGAQWWILAWAILMAFSILMSWAFPTFIAPLFNKFTPLADTTLKARIEALLERCGFHAQGIFVMDGSKRSGHGNAYFTGIGNNKRIVFFDTLVDSLNHDEIEAVLAHELGHFKRRHVLKMLAGTSLVTLAGFGLLGWLSGEGWFYQGLGVSEQSNAIALLLFMLVSPVFSVFLQPIMAYVQRRYEFEADDFAAGHTRARYLVNALVKLYRENASTLTPDPLYAAFHYSHPPAAIRIDHLAAKI